MATTMDTTADATAKDAPVIERVDVAADGDLVLLVGGKLELRVHSLLLKMNSPVFRAMLGPNWLEGQSLSSISETTPGTLALPDDDAQGMKYLCFMLHNQHDNLTGGSRRTGLLDIAKLADKVSPLTALACTRETLSTNTIAVRMCLELQTHLRSLVVSLRGCTL